MMSPRARCGCRQQVQPSSCRAATGPALCHAAAVHPIGGPKDHSLSKSWATFVIGLVKVQRPKRDPSADHREHHCELPWSGVLARWDTRHNPHPPSFVGPFKLPFKGGFKGNTSSLPSRGGFEDNPSSPSSRGLEG